MIAKGQDASNIRLGDTLADDQFCRTDLRLLPLQPAVRRGLESLARRPSRSESARPRLPLLARCCRRSATARCCSCPHLAHKMRPAHEGGGRAGIVFNGSPLFTGAAESGQSRDPPLAARERSGGGDRRAADEHVLQHRHRHLHLDPRQHQTPRAARQSPADRRDLVLHQDPQEPRREEPRGRRRGA